MKYSIVSGFHSKGDGSAEAFFPVWFNNTMKFSDPARVIVIADSGARIPCGDWIPEGEWPGLLSIELTGDCGFFMHLVNAQKFNKFNGWSAVIMAGAMICYADEADMIFKEQDCLWFGDCVGKMYEEIGTAGGIWGNCSFMPCEQSLFLLKHAAIPDFVQQFLNAPAQNCEPEFGEAKFFRMERQFPGQYLRHTLGPGRDRPLTFDAPLWYAQKYSQEEIEELKRRELI